MSSDAHLCHKTWPMVIKALIRRFLTIKSASRSTRFSNSTLSKGQKMSDWNLRPAFLRLSESIITMFSAMEKLTTTFTSWKPSICKEMVEHLRHMHPNVRSCHIDIESIAATKSLAQHALMKHPQPQQWMNFKTRNKRIPNVFAH